MTLHAPLRGHVVLSPGIVLDCQRACLSTATGTEIIPLTSREVDIMCFLWDRRGTFVSRADLLVHVWGYRTGALATRTVDVHVQKLRAKLDRIPDGRTWIATARGRGYGWVDAQARCEPNPMAHVA